MSNINFMDELNNKINSLSNMDLWKTPQNIHILLWNDINKLSHHDNKLELIENWEYKDAFLYTEKTHKNGEYIFHNMSWEESFVLTFMYRHFFYKN